MRGEGDAAEMSLRERVAILSCEQFVGMRQSVRKRWDGRHHCSVWSATFVRGVHGLSVRSCRTSLNRELKGAALQVVGGVRENDPMQRFGCRFAVA